MSPQACVLSSWSLTSDMTLGHAGDLRSDITRGGMSLGLGLMGAMSLVTVPLLSVFCLL